MIGSSAGPIAIAAAAAALAPGALAIGDSSTGADAGAAAPPAEIAFQRAAPNFDVYVMSANGRGVRRVTRRGGEDPAWSPDGRRIAFARFDDTRSRVLSSIWTIRADGSGERRLTSGSELHWRPAWSPDGRRIAFEAWGRGGSAIAVVAAAGGRRRLLTSFEHGDHAPAFSPDGRRIAFVRGKDDATDLFVMDADGSRPRRLLRHRGEDADPAWSPDGRWIAFGGNSGGRRFQVFVVRPDGSGLRRLARSRGGQPSWSPDGRRIAFASGRDGDPEIYVMDSDGGDERKLTANRAQDQQPAWRPQPDQAATDGSAPARATCVPTSERRHRCGTN